MDSSEHRRMADAAQIGTSHLSEALNRMKESQQKTMQIERLHVYEQVIRGVVHDFGESLTPIQGTVDMLLSYPEKMPSDSEVLHHLHTMSEAVQNAGRSRIKIKKITCPDGFSGSKPPGYVPADGTRTMTFAPVWAATYTGSLTVITDKPGVTAAQPCSGTGITAGTVDAPIFGTGSIMITRSVFLHRDLSRYFNKNNGSIVLSSRRSTDPQFSSGLSRHTRRHPAGRLNRKTT
jgi:hypothetical protein